MPNCAFCPQLVFFPVSSLMWPNSNCDQTQNSNWDKTFLKLWQNLNYDKSQFMRRKINVNGSFSKNIWHLDNRCNVLWTAFCDSHNGLLCCPQIYFTIVYKNTNILLNVCYILFYLMYHDKFLNTLLDTTVLYLRLIYGMIRVTFTQWLLIYIASLESNFRLSTRIAISEN